MPAKRNNIRVFVASTVYNFEYQLQLVRELLDGYGYDVVMSAAGTLPLDSSKSNMDVCIDAVKTCDIFLGFIRPDYGSGVLDRGKESITHAEFITARGLEIPRFVLADYRVVFTRQLLKNAFFVEDHTQKRIDMSNVSLEGNGGIMDTRCIVMYNEAISDHIKPASKRTGNWVQEYVNFDQIKMHLDSQFAHPERIKALIDKGKK
ncbi:DUF4062 domain-containing protein [Pedobacter paludis]|uniref:DUF4062 domain-containing protein n=1 Tax=Pedobacter paludis TaxID=2203212 RepID=A0A317F2J0_9SPHI|nr:DUF4062 domain-containing protein [Pedobacter paludis]PWS32257.1 hypothetical protein DF947_10845 [Pedobacter paludis]